MLRISTSEVIGRTIELLQEDDSLNMMRVKLLRKFIENENRSIVSPIHEWSRSNWVEYEEEIKAKQSLII